MALAKIYVLIATAQAEKIAPIALMEKCMKAITMKLVSLFTANALNVVDVATKLASRATDEATTPAKNATALEINSQMIRY